MAKSFFKFKGKNNSKLFIAIYIIEIMITKPIFMLV